MENKYFRGDMYYTALGEGIGSEQQGYRPTVIIQNDVGNNHSPTVVVSAVTGKPKGEKLPTHLSIGAVCGLKEPSVVLLEQLRTVDKSRLIRYIGHLDDDNMRNIDRLCEISLGLKCKTPDILTMCLCYTCAEYFRNTGAHRVYRLDPEQTVRDTCTYCNYRSGFDYIIIEKKPKQNFY